MSSFFKDVLNLSGIVPSMVGSYVAWRIVEMVRCNVCCDDERGNWVLRRGNLRQRVPLRREGRPESRTVSGGLLWMQDMEEC
jgi:hypothetical protein